MGKDNATQRLLHQLAKAKESAGPLEILLLQIEAEFRRAPQMDALEKLPRKKFDLVITDLNMPNMDGFDLIRSLRENPEFKDLPVIILTSLSDGASKEEGSKLGVSSYVVKPFSLEKIQYEVAKYISWAD